MKTAQGRWSLTAVLVLCASLTPMGHAWINDYDQPVSFQCPTGQFLAHVNSMHNSNFEDRVWDFDCRTVPVDGDVTNCHWTSKYQQGHRSCAMA